jgi:hypothetical protein
MGIEGHHGNEGPPIINLDEEVAKILRPKGIEAPPIQVHVALHRHVTKGDAEGLREDIAGADIVIPELIGGGRNRNNILNKLSQGKITDIDAAQRLLGGIDPIGAGINALLLDGHIRRLLTILQGSKKAIGFVDLEPGSQESKTGSQLYEKLKTSIRHIGLGKEPTKEFSTAVQEELNNANEWAQINMRREESMIGNLPGVIAQLIEDNAHLRRENHSGPLRVVMTIGAGHMRIPKLLEQGGNSVTSRIPPHDRYRSRDRTMTERAFSGEKLTKEDGEYIVTRLVFKGLAGSYNPRKDDIFSALRRSLPSEGAHDRIIKSRVDGIIADILSEVFWDRREEIYNAPRDTKQKRRALYEKLIAERQIEIEAAVKNAVETISADDSKPTF